MATTGATGTANETETVQILRWEYVAAMGGYMLMFRAADSDAFAEALACVKDVPAMLRRWLPAERAWWIHTAAANVLINDFPALRAYVAAHAGRTGGSSGSSGSSGSTGRASSSSSARLTRPPEGVAAAFAALHLTPSAPVELVAAARRVLARRNHPDAGGSHAAMVAVNNAADTCERWIAEHSA